MAVVDAIRRSAAERSWVTPELGGLASIHDKRMPSDKIRSIGSEKNGGSLQIVRPTKAA